MSRRSKVALKVLLLLAGLAVFAGLIVAAGPGRIASQLERFGWAFPLFLLPYLAVYLLDAWGWQQAFEHPPGVGFWRLFLVRTAGESVNYSLPSAYVGGEPVKALILKRMGVSGVDAAASVIVAKTTMTVGQILFILIGIGALALSLPESKTSPGLLLGSAVCLVLGAVVVIALIWWQRSGFSRPLFSLARKTGLGIDFLESKADSLKHLDDALIRFHQSRRGHFWTSTLLFLLGWMAGTFEVWIFSEFLGLELGLPACLAIESLATIAKGAAFFIPGSLGAQEGGNVLLFMAYGCGEVVGVTFSILRRIRELLWIGLGYGLMAWFGLAPQDVVRAGPEDLERQESRP